MQQWLNRRVSSRASIRDSQSKCVLPCTYFIKTSKKKKNCESETTTLPLSVLMLQTRIRRIFIRRACQSSHGSMVCRFVPWRYPCSVASDKTRTQSARDGIFGTWPLCSDLKPKTNNHIIWCGFPSAGNLVLTSDRFVASCTQGSPLGVVVRLAIRQSLVIEEGTSLKLLPAILQKKHRTMHLRKLYGQILHMIKICFQQRRSSANVL